MQSLEPPGTAANGTSSKGVTVADLVPIVLGLLKRRWYLLLAGLICLS